MAACRASLAKLFETETQFIGLGWSSDQERGVLEESRGEEGVSDKQT